MLISSSIWEHHATFLPLSELHQPLISSPNLTQGQVNDHELQDFSPSDTTENTRAKTYKAPTMEEHYCKALCCKQQAAGDPILPRKPRCASIETSKCFKTSNKHLPNNLSAHKYYLLRLASSVVVNCWSPALVCGYTHSAIQTQKHTKLQIQFIRTKCCHWCQRIFTVFSHYMRQMALPFPLAIGKNNFYQ